MRATRAYLAGFGTSGSLLAGAALMFLLASAFVAFQGWPQVAGQSAPVLVSVPRVPAPAATQASRALAATTAAPAHRPATHARHPAAALKPTARLGSAHARRGSDQTTVTPVSRDPGTGHRTGPTPTPRTCATCSHSGSAGGSPVSTARKTVQGTVGNAVTTVKKLLPGGSSGSSNGGTVGGVVTTATTVVNTATTVAKGVTGGLP